MQQQQRKLIAAAMGSLFVLGLAANAHAADRKPEMEK